MQPEQTPTVTPPTVSPPDNQPTPIATPDAPMNSGFFPKKSSKKKLIIAGAVAVVLLGGGAAGAMWWTSPQKTFDDMMSSYELPTSARVKGTMDITPSSGMPVTVGFTTKFADGRSNSDLSLKMDAGAMKLDFTGAFATGDNKSLYFKVNDIRKTVESLAGSNTWMVEETYGEIINKVDGKWVEVTESDMKDASKDSGTDFGCVSDALVKITKDTTYVKDAYAIYEKNKYMSLKETIGSESVDGRDSHHFMVAVDKAKMDAFNKAMEKSKIAVDLKKCMTASDDTAAFDATESTSPKLEIWADKWSHKLTKIVMTQDQEGTTVKLTATFDYAKQTVSTPKADTQFKDLMELMGGSGGSFMQTTDDASGIDLTQI